MALFVPRNLNRLTASLPQVVVPGAWNLTLPEPGTYTFFCEPETVVAGKMYATGPISGLRLAVTSKADGSPILLSKPSAHTEYTLGGRQGVSLFTFIINTPGVYELAAEYSRGKEGPEVVLAVGKGFMGKLMATVGGAMAIALVCGGGGIAIALATFSRRKKTRRKLEVAFA